MEPKKRWERERTESKKQRESSIVEAAERVFARKGYEKATMQDIAAEDSVGIATVFRYFPKKERLIVAVAAKIIDSQIAVFQAIADGPGSCCDKLETLLDHLITFIGAEHSQNTRLLESFESYAAQTPEPLEDMETYNRMFRQTTAIFNRIIEQGKHDGSIRPDIDVHDTLTTIIDAFGIFMKKLSLHKSILMLESEMVPETQLHILKAIFLDYVKA